MSQVAVRRTHSGTQAVPGAVLGAVPAAITWPRRARGHAITRAAVSKARAVGEQCTSIHTGLSQPVAATPLAHVLEGRVLHMCLIVVQKHTKQQWLA